VLRDDDLDKKAKSSALESLMQAMGDDDMKRKPLLTITIDQGGKGVPEGEELEPEGIDDMDGEGFAERLRRERGY
jgi:hypothetical protein